MGGTVSLPTALTAISTKIQSADPMCRQRALRRLAAAVLVVLYARRTNQSLGQQRVLLAQDEQLPPSEQLCAAVRYTIWGQLIASSEYLLCLVKPALAARIGRLLVRTPRDAIANLTYGPNDRNTLDLYGVGGAPKPVIVFMHGGAWSFGHKWQYALVGEYLATQGFLVAVVNYRTFPAGSVMDMVEDIENAVYWVADHCQAYGGDERRIYLSGHSSGAHVGALALTLSSIRVAATGGSKTRPRELVDYVAGFIGLAAPYHIADHYVFESNRIVGPINGVHEISSMKPAMLGRTKFDQSSPTALIETNALQHLKLPPFHLIHGVDDGVVPISSSKRFAAALRQAGQQVEYVEIPDCTHEGLVFAVMGDDVACRDAAIKHIRRIIFGSPQVSTIARPTPLSSKL